MRIDKIEVNPVQESINPELEFEIEIYIKSGYEIPLEITGCVFLENNKKLANVHGFIYEPNKTIVLSAQDKGSRGGEKQKLIIKVITPLNNKVLDYIETLRTENPKSDVILNLDIFVKTLISKANLSHMFFLKELDFSYKLPNPYEKAMPIFYKYQSKLPERYVDMWILSGNGSPTFIEIKNSNFKKEVIIRSSDWIHDYCSVFQIGRFSVFEYLMPDYTEGSGSVEERLNKSINAIRNMEKNMIKAEWNQVIADSRAVWELLRNQDEIKGLFRRDGYTDEAVNDLFGYKDSNGTNHHGCFNNLFNFASKFIHKLDKKKEVQPDIKASKEDAYLIYATSMNIVNLISKKMQRLNR
jgi:hypothetical protein